LNGHLGVCRQGWADYSLTPTACHYTVNFSPGHDWITRTKYESGLPSKAGEIIMELKET